MSVIYDEKIVPVPEGVATGENKWASGRELGAALRALPVGSSLTCDRKARSVLRLLYTMRSPEGNPLRWEYLAVDQQDHPGWCRVWRMRSGKTWAREAGWLNAPGLPPNEPQA